MASPLVAAAVYLDLSYLGFGIMAGLAVGLFTLVFEKDDGTPSALGVFFLAVGLTALLAAIYYASAHGLSFEALSNERDVSRFVRRLPYYAVCITTAGAVLCAYSWWRSRTK